MCDTQIIRTAQHTYFAKNSDREAAESQHIVRIPPVEFDSNKKLQTTYLSIPQSPKRYGVILSQPCWIWGAEMGVNTEGVAIGNEAVFTRLVNKKGKALLGMDLVRLGLERSSCADEALSVITRLLDTYGQGGNAGYRQRSFRYDNSFIIADARKAWILETAGNWWVARKVGHYGAISNALSIGEDYDLAKQGVEDFARKQGYTKRFQTFSFAAAFDTHLMPYFGAARSRRQLSLSCLRELHQNQQVSFPALINNLRQHHREMDDFRQHSNRDVCMHAAHFLRPSQTCGSLVAELGHATKPQVMATGTSAPCLSLFKPLDFEFDRTLFSEFNTRHQPQQSLWQRFESIHRRALKDSAFRQQLRETRDLTEKQMFTTAVGGKIQVGEGDRLGQRWHEEWERRVKNQALNYQRFSLYDRFWQNA